MKGTYYKLTDVNGTPCLIDQNEMLAAIMGDNEFTVFDMTLVGMTLDVIRELRAEYLALGGMMPMTTESVRARLGKWLE